MQLSEHCSCRSDATTILRLKVEEIFDNGIDYLHGHKNDKCISGTKERENVRGSQYDDYYSAELQLFGKVVREKPSTKLGHDFVWMILRGWYITAVWPFPVRGKLNALEGFDLYM